MIKNNSYLLLLTLPLVSCGKIEPKGEIEQKKIYLKTIADNNTDFSGINAKGKFRVFWVHSPQNTLEIETYPNFINNLKMSINDKILNINEDRETKGLGFYNITIFSESIPKNITLSDSVEFNVSGKIDVENFTLNLKNSTKFIGFVHSKKMNLNMLDVSLANFKGFTDNINLNIKDSAQIVAPYMYANVLNINANNSPFAEFSIKDTIKGNIKNTTKLWYYGNPIFKAKKDKTTQIKKEKQK